MHFCRADITLGGDTNNVFHAGDFAPISWPEVQIIQYVHGDENIDNIEPFVSVQQTPLDERRRLIAKYGDEAVQAVFARQNPGEMEAPQAKLQDGITWQNPLSGRIETTGTKEAPPDPADRKK
jgi:hypothetical protein